MFFEGIDISIMGDVRILKIFINWFIFLGFFCVRLEKRNKKNEWRGFGNVLFVFWEVNSKNLFWWIVNSYYLFLDCRVGWVVFRW